MVQVARAPIGKQRPVYLRVVRGGVEYPDLGGLVAGPAGQHRLRHREGVEQEAELAVRLSCRVHIKSKHAMCHVVHAIRRKREREEEKEGEGCRRRMGVGGPARHVEEE